METPTRHIPQKKKEKKKRPEVRRVSLRTKLMAALQSTMAGVEEEEKDIRRSLWNGLQNLSMCRFRLSSRHGSAPRAPSSLKQCGQRTRSLRWTAETCRSRSLLEANACVQWSSGHGNRRLFVFLACTAGVGQSDSVGCVVGSSEPPVRSSDAEYGSVEEWSSAETGGR